MTEPTDLPTPGSRDLFFRVADRLQLEGCLHAVVQESKSVVVLSPSSALLDHYGQMLVQRLRQRLPHTSTEVFFPTHTEALIGRFNALLEHLSVDAATQLSGPSAPEKLWIIHDANALPEHELKLLLRLLQHFPGARIGAVLMLNELPPALRGIDPQGRRILRWDIEPPGQAQVELFMSQARELGREVAALELVSRVYAPDTRASVTATEAPSAAPPAAAPAIAMPAPAATASRQEAAEPTRPSPEGQRPRHLLAHGAQWLRSRLSPQAGQGLRQHWRWALGVLMLLAFSVAVALWLQPKPTQRSTPAAAEKTSPLAEAKAHPTAPVIETELPELAQQGLAWLRVIGPGVFVVDHGLFATAQDAQKKIGNARLFGARVLPHYSPEADTAQFVVITGPYPSEERARSFIQRVDQSAKVRSSASVLALAQASPDTPQKR